MTRQEFLLVGLGLFLSSYHPIPPAQVQEEIEMTILATDTLTITILYDNNPYDPRLSSAWGFAALVEYHKQKLLMDTGGDGQVLLSNMSHLGVDLLSIEYVLLSHAHGDHTGGLNALLAAGARPTVYLLSSFPSVFKRQVASLTKVVEVGPGQPLGEGLFTTGAMDGGIHEQALVVQSKRGLVVITGCAHPGVASMMARAKALFGDPVYFVMGGFHLGGKSKSEIAAILAEFRQLGVKQVVPCHCTGDLASAMFATEYGDDFIRAGVGRAITFEL
ncbi:MAG: MBL fold metallo-hydrolase [Candidatus Neomarinimicrobiota bacterium]